MSGVLWQKKGVEIDEAIMRFLAGDDVVLDRELFTHDITASAAHARGLASIGVLSREDTEAICDTLDELRTLWDRGQFILNEQYEDGHSAIESFLTEKLGPVGGKVHLGRSRNDQVLTATRLYMRASLDTVLNLLIECARAALTQAKAHEMAPMPGYTHLQRAVPSTLGLWCASFAESFASSAQLVKFTRDWVNASPLGTAAGYGVNLPLAREQTARELGFDGLAINPMAAQASRGKHEHQVLAALWQAMQDVRRLAWDLSLFATQEFAFVKMPASMTTGSSIMPNKRNPDLAELLRASSAVIAGCMNELQQVLSLPSGYHRDLQLTKGPLIRAVRTTIDALSLVPGLINGCRFDLDRMRDSIDSSMMATDHAVDLAVSGVPFRDAYKRIADEIQRETPADPEASVQSRTSPGACAELMLGRISAQIDALSTS